MICTLCFVTGIIILCLEGTWKALFQVSEPPSMNLKVIIWFCWVAWWGVDGVGCSWSVAVAVDVARVVLDLDLGRFGDIASSLALMLLVWSC